MEIGGQLLFKRLKKEFGIHPIPEDSEDPLYDVFVLMHDDKCMTCGGHLGETTLVLMQTQGIGGVWCSGVCLSDMQVMGFLQEAHDDIVDKINYRGGKGDG